MIERDEPDVPKAKANEKKVNGNQDVRSKGGKKQLSIATMFKPQPAKPAKRKQDLVVRITNQRGFGERIRNELANLI